MAPELPAPAQGPPQGKDPVTPARIVYFLYLAGILIHLLGVIGVITAYVYRGDASPWLQTHYRYQIRTFWMGLLYLVAGLFLSAFLVGYLVFLWWLIWLTVRCVKGLKALGRHAPVPDPETWWF